MSLCRCGPYYLTALLIVCGSPGLASASTLEAMATVHVRILEPASLPAPAIVDLTSNDKPSMVFRAEVSNAERMTVFRQVPAGAYRLAVRLLGFKDVAVDVLVDATSTYEFAVELRDVLQQAESSLRLIQAAPAANLRVFDRSAIETFPGDDGMWAVVETAVAPVIVDRMSTGGLWAGEAALVGGQAGSWRQTTFALGALDMSDPVRTGTPLMRADHQSVEELIVSTAMLPASIAGPGPMLAVVPRSAASVWRGSGTFGVFPNALQADNAKPGAPSIARFGRHRDSSVEIGGPLAHGAGLFLSAHVATTDRLERDDPTPLGTSVASLFANTTATAGSRGRLRFVASLDRTGFPYAGRARFLGRDARERDTFGSAQVTWDRWSADGAARSVSVGFARGAIAPAVDRFSAADLSRVNTVERLGDGAVATLFDVMPGTRSRWMGSVDVAPKAAWLGSRQTLSAGATMAYNVAQTRGVASPPVAEMVDSFPARLWEFRFAGPDMRWTSTELAGHVVDRILLTRRLRAEAGLRIDLAHGSARGASNSISWLFPAPRLSIRWSAGREGRFSLYGGYADYAHRLPLDYFAYGDPAAASGRVYRWVDTNGDRAFQEGERGVLIAATGPCCAGGVVNGIAPKLEVPYTRELAGGVDVRFLSWSLSIVGIDRHERHSVGLLNTGVQKSDYLVRYLPDLGERYVESEDDRLLAVYDRQPSSFGLDHYLLTNPATPGMEYLGADVTVAGSITKGWRTRFDGSVYHGAAVGSQVGFGALENDQGSIGAVFENPNAETYSRGHPFFDRGYVMKWWTSYVLPRDYIVSAVARYQDGQAFSRLVVVTDLNQGPEAIQAYRRGRTRFTFTFTLDAHVEKRLTIGRARVAGVLELFNLLNTRNEVEEDIVTSASFRTSTAVQPPRAGRIALRIGF